MKPIIILTLVLLLPLLASAQQKDITDSIEFRYGLPISEDDSTQHMRPEDDPANEWIEVSRSQLPENLKSVLNDNDAYEGWENGKVYFDKSIDQYILRMRFDKAIRTYGFLPDGSSVSFSEELIVDRDSVR